MVELLDKYKHSLNFFWSNINFSEETDSGSNFFLSEKQNVIKQHF